METTIVNTMQKHTPGRPLSVGGPTPNNRVYILDSELDPVPIGVAGTIWAGGRGVSRGYVGLQGLTDEKYIADKFAADGFVDKRVYGFGNGLADIGQVENVQHGGHWPLATRWYGPSAGAQ